MKPYVFIGLTFLSILSGCGKFNLTPEININFQDPTDVTETSFRISWPINTTDYQANTFVLAEDPGFEQVLE